jgi:alkaline phosphatase D
MIPDLKFAETSHRGYLTVTFTPSAAVGEWIFVTSVLENDFSASVGGRMQMLPGSANRVLLPA